LLSEKANKRKQKRETKTCKHVLVKPRPNDHNISTQHIATLLGAARRARLATLLRHVAACWVLLAQI